MTPPVLTDEDGPVPGIDPRIRARRIAVRRGEGRRRLRRSVGIAAALGAALVVAAVVVGVVRSPLLDVDRVVVVGAERTGDEQVRASAGIAPGDRLATADVAGAADSLRALPWVADAAVERAWPGTVRISVVERQPVAALAFPGVGGGTDEMSLVDAEGRVLGVVPRGEAGAVAVVEGLGPPGPPGRVLSAEAEGALALAGALPASLRDDVERIVVTEGASLRLDLRVGEDAGPDEVVVVRFGDHRRLASKLSALVTVVASVDLGDVAVIDVGVPSVPALTPRSSGA